MVTDQEDFPMILDDLKSAEGSLRSFEQTYKGLAETLACDMMHGASEMPR